VEVCFSTLVVSILALEALTFSLELPLFFGGEVLVLLKMVVASDFTPLDKETGVVRMDAIMTIKMIRTAAPPIMKNKFLFDGFTGGVIKVLWVSSRFPP
jgi:hypothetical protein